MRGVYTAKFLHTALAAIKNLMILEVPADTVVEILSCEVTNRSNETNEQLDCAVIRGSGGTKGTPGGTATPVPHEVGDQASGVTVTHSWQTADPTDGVELHGSGAPSLSGYAWDPTPEERGYVPPSGILMVKLKVAPSSAIDCEVRLTFREIG